MPFLPPNQQRQSTEGKLHINNDNKKTKRNFKTENTLGMPKTRTESLYVFEKGTRNKQLVQSFIAELVAVTDRQTYRQTYSDNMPHFMH